ncbi:glycosyltransferase family 2 protein [Microbacterium sp. gxy059]|uniref:glycosyltransferase family 2 protein n=1 Tax=Microbacterium sp. gxy059 TaxID=2957199 RepID=UPI003D963B01
MAGTERGDRAAGGTSPLLSVVIPTHNVRPWVRQTLDSVLEQDVDPLEVIVVDDRSSDGTREYLDERAAEDPRLVVLSSDAPGGGSARNTGADRARGRFLVFCDGDDLVPRGAYRALVDGLIASGSDIAFGDFLKFRAADTWRPTAAMAAYGRRRSGATLADDPTLLYSRACWNKAFRRDFWEREGIRFPDVPRSNDIRPMTSAYLAAGRVDTVPDVVYVYRERPGSGSMTSRAASPESLLSYLEQESACARLVAARRDAGLERVFSNLVWDRDGYVHVAKHLLALTEGEGDPRVSTAVAGLLALSPAPTGSVPAPRELVLRLTAEGEIRAARAAARAGAARGEAAEVEDAEAWRDWDALFRVFEEGDGPTDEERLVLAERFARQVGARVPRQAEEWRRLVERARRVLGDRAAMFSPSAHGLSADDARRVDLAERVDAKVSGIAGGQVLVVEGSALARDVSPGLFDAETGEARVIPPASVAWRADGERQAFSAAFPVASLPLHRPLSPVVSDGAGLVVPLAGEASLPPYAARDAFLYDGYDGVTVVRRRRHWIPRGARRALLAVRVRLGR